MAWALLWLKLTDYPMADLQQLSPVLMAFIIGAGPVLLAQTMANITDTTKRSIFYPFHKVIVIINPIIS